MYKLADSNYLYYLYSQMKSTTYGSKISHYSFSKYDIVNQTNTTISTTYLDLPYYLCHEQTQL